LPEDVGSTVWPHAKILPMSESPCTRAEAYKIVEDAGGWQNVQPEAIKRLRTLSDEDLASFCQSWDVFATTESNRRLSEALRQEALRTTHLTIWIRRWTVALVALTVLLVFLTLGLLWLTMCGSH
jgi:hypothetical protein